MVSEFEDLTMADLVSLKAAKIEAQHPDIKNKNSSTSPCRKVSCKDGVVFNVETLIKYDED